MQTIKRRLQYGQIELDSRLPGSDFITSGVLLPRRYGGKTARGRRTIWNSRRWEVASSPSDSREEPKEALR